MAADAQSAGPAGAATRTSEASARLPETVNRDDLHARVLPWFAAHARELPWRDPSAGAWGVLVSEVMLQQTPVVRVEPAWRAWMARWPAPADLAAASGADVLRAWDRLGYPRRALRLRAAAQVIVDRHGGEVPATEPELLALPGVGSYTAAAIAAFAYRQRAVVLDTNVRRVLERAVGGAALPPPSLRRAETERAAALLPADTEESAAWNAGLMELGALVCTARSPRCADCPLACSCAWLRAGQPADEYANKRRTQAWHGTDRQARGRILADLRAAAHPLADSAVAAEWPDAAQRSRALATLIADGLLAVEHYTGEGDATGVTYRLPN